MCVEHNIETLRTRVTQVADLRDAQGIRRDHHVIVARLNEVEEYASANTFRELMTRIQRLESMLCRKWWRYCWRSHPCFVVDEEISNRLCWMKCRIAYVYRIRMLRDLMRTLKMSLAEKIELWTEDEEGVLYPMESGPMPRPPPQTVDSETAQQAMQRLHVAYTQCVNRTNHVEERLSVPPVQSRGMQLTLHLWSTGMNRVSLTTVEKSDN